MMRAFLVLAIFLLTAPAYAAEPVAEIINRETAPAPIPDAFAPLTSYKNKSAEDWIAALRTRDDPAQLKAALEAIAELCPIADGAAAIVDDLLAILKASNDVETSRLALFALGKFGPDAQSCESHLVGVLANVREAPLVRAAACRALIQIAPASTMVRNVILAATSAPSAELRREAFDALIILCMPAAAGDAPIAPIAPIVKKIPATAGRAKPVVQTFPPGLFPYPPAFEALAKAALTARDATDADAALRTLGDAGVEPLLRALECNSPLARAVAADTLGGMHRTGPRALPALLNAARKETDRHARDAEVFAAAVLSPRDSVVLDFLAENVGARPDPLTPTRARVTEDLLLDAGKESLPALRKAMRSDVAAKRLALLKLVAQLAAPDLPDTTALKSSEVAVRRSMPAAPLQLEECLNDIVCRLRDSDESVRLFAAQTLNRVGPPAANAMNALQKAAEVNAKSVDAKNAKIDSAEFQRLCAIAALNVSRDAASPAFLTPLDLLSVEQLAALLANTSTSDRADAALALRLHATDAAAFDILIKSLDDTDPKVRRAAARALGAFGERAAPAIPTLIKWLQSEPKSRWTAIETIADFGPIAAPAALALVKSTAEDAWPSEPDFARTLVRALRPHADTVVPALSGYVRSGSPQVRARSAQALALLGPSAAEALPELVELAQSTDDAEALAAFDALRAIGPEKDPNAIPYLSSVIHDSLFAMRRKWAVRALGLSRPALDADVPERTGALCAALVDGDVSVCQAACDALIQAGEPSIPLLVDLALHEKGAHNYWPLIALAAMSAEPDIVLPRLFAYTLPDAPAATRAAALEHLGRYAKARPDAIAALIRSLRSRDNATAHAAMRALLPIAADVRPVVERLLFDRDPAVRRNAAEALDTFQ